MILQQIIGAGVTLWAGYAALRAIPAASNSTTTASTAPAASNTVDMSPSTPLSLDADPAGLVRLPAVVSTRIGVLTELLYSLGMLMFVRLIVDYEGWTYWFIYIWMVGIASFVFAVYRAGLTWLELPQRTKDSKALRSQMLRLAFSVALILIIAGAIVLPGLFLS